MRDHYQEHGWYVTKAGASLGLWDLIAIHPVLGTQVVQVKTNRAPGGKEKDRLQKWADKFTSVKCVIAIVRDRKDTEYRQFK